MGAKTQKAVAVLGTTASGKSDLGIALAARFGGEIISADSRQVYRGFDLCSGKSTPEERGVIAHHLMDIRDVGERFSVADFQAETYKLIPEITECGALPLIVGGTGLYIDSILLGYELTGGPPDYAARAELEQMSDDELRAALRALDSEYREPSETYTHNRRRMIRILESARTGGAVGYEHSPVFDVLPLGVTWPRDELRERIRRRLNTRLDAGMTDEVADYLKAGGDPEVMRALGLEFRCICDYLMGGYASLDELRERLYTEICRFAKRQSTWFRRNKNIVWLDTSGDFAQQAAEKIGHFLESR
jgi:tRNA dimethylallyltransferase